MLNNVEQISGKKLKKKTTLSRASVTKGMIKQSTAGTAQWRQASKKIRATSSMGCRRKYRQRSAWREIFVSECRCGGGGRGRGGGRGAFDEGVGGEGFPAEEEHEERGAGQLGVVGWPHHGGGAPGGSGGPLAPTTDHRRVGSEGGGRVWF